MIGNVKKENAVRRAISVVLLIVLVLFIGSQFNCSKNNSISEKPTKVVISQAFQHLLYIGLYVANDKGFFKEQGLDVTINTAGGDAQAFSALTSGKADFAQGDPAFVAIAYEKGWEGRVVAMAVNRVAIWGVTFDKNIEPFTDPIGFKGKTVATYPEPNTSYVVQKQLIQKAGLKLGVDTKILQVPFGTELSTLKNKQADIAQTVEPNVSMVEEEGGRVVFSYPKAWGPLAFTGLMTSKKLIDENPQLVRKVVTAYEKALQYVQHNFEGTVEVAKQELPDLDEKIIRKALRRLIDSGSIPPHTTVTEESWRKLLQIRIDVGDLKKMPDKILYDNSFRPKQILN